MNPKYVTSLELSKKLKEAGVKQESEWYWVYEDHTASDDPAHGVYGEWKLLSFEDAEGTEYEYCSAFHVGELGEMLQKYSSRSLNKALVETNDVLIDPFGEFWLAMIELMLTPDNLGKMVLYLKENKLI